LPLVIIHNSSTFYHPAYNVLEVEKRRETFKDNQTKERKLSMKKILSFTSIILVLGFVAFLETQAESYHGFSTSFHDVSNEESAEVIAETEKEQESVTYSSSEYIFEEEKVENGYRIEIYREHEIHEDEEGNRIKHVPTSNYNYLRYKIMNE
jgi:hypothetical protein